MRPTYARNSFQAVLNTAVCHGLRVDGHRLLTIGEREPDGKIVEADRLGFVITVIEAFGPNINKIKSAWPSWSYLHMNCLELPQRVESGFDLLGFDLIWWYHGPEHLEKADAWDLLMFLRKRARFIICSMPHGDYPQDVLYGNTYERHLSKWYKDDLREVGTVYAETDRGDDRSSLDVFIAGASP